MRLPHLEALRDLTRAAMAVIALGGSTALFPESPSPSAEAKYAMPGPSFEASVRSTGKVLDGPDTARVVANTLKTHRIIGLGEATHGTSEIFRMKADLVKELVRDGVRTLLFELPVSGAFRLDDYLQGGAGEPIASVLSRCSVYFSWRVEEVGDLFGWIREWNQTHPDDRVHVYGCDPQSPDLDQVFSFLSKEIPGFKAEPYRDRLAAARKVIEAEGERFSKTAKGMTFKTDTAPVKREIYAETRDVMELLTLLQTVPQDRPGWVRSQLSLQAYEQQCQGDLEHARAWDYPENNSDEVRFAAPYAVRDIAMAENAAYVQNHLAGKDGRVILWAHSYHVARQPLKLDDGIPLGTYLAEWYADAYAVLNVTVGDGVVRAVVFDKDGMVGNGGSRTDITINPTDPASLEGIVGSAFPGHTVLLDVHRLSDVQRARRMRAIGWDYHPSDEILNYFDGPVTAFDQVLYLPKGSAAKGLRP